MLQLEESVNILTDQEHLSKKYVNPCSIKKMTVLTKMFEI